MGSEGTDPLKNPRAGPGKLTAEGMDVLALITHADVTLRLSRHSGLTYGMRGNEVGDFDGERLTRRLFFLGLRFQWRWARTCATRTVYSDKRRLAHAASTILGAHMHALRHTLLSAALGTALTATAAEAQVTSPALPVPPPAALPLLGQSSPDYASLLARFAAARGLGTVVDRDTLPAALRAVRQATAQLRDQLSPSARVSCPMPVAKVDPATLERMPVADADTSTREPSARQGTIRGCVNPLQR